KIVLGTRKYTKQKIFLNSIRRSSCSRSTTTATGCSTAPFTLARALCRRPSSARAPRARGARVGLRQAGEAPRDGEVEGAAGLTSSSVEMAGRSGSGLELDLDRVPRRA